MANYTDGLKAAYCYWPFILIGLYTVVPARYGNLYFDTCNLAWAVALSYFANRNKTALKQVNSVVSQTMLEPVKDENSVLNLYHTSMKRPLFN